jgi:hypothetical protein
MNSAHLEPQGTIHWYFDETGGSLGDGTFEWAVWQTLASLGSAALMAAQPLSKRIEEFWSDDGRMLFLLRCLAEISPHDALAYCERIAKKSTEDYRAEYAVHIAYHCGMIAIPVLKKFSAFLDNNGAKSAIRCLREGYPWSMPRIARGY